MNKALKKLVSLLTYYFDTIDQITNSFDLPGLERPKCIDKAVIVIARTTPAIESTIQLVLNLHLF